MYTFVARDEYNAEREFMIAVNVLQTNRAPEFIGSNDPLNFAASGELYEFPIANYFSDPDGDTFTFTLSSSDTDIAKVMISDESFAVKPLSAGDAELTFTVTDIHGGSVTKSITAKVTTVMGIDKPSQAFSINAFPNPTQGKVDVHVDGEIGSRYSIRLLNSMAQKLSEEENVKMRDHDAELDLTNLPAGMYYVEIIDNKGASNTVRIVKE